MFRQEQARVAARFEEAVRLTEEAFVSEFGKLVSHLTERLSGSDDGKPKVFRDSAVENLGEFFTRFRQLNVGKNAQLDELVAQAQRVIRGVEPQQLRDSTALAAERRHATLAVQSVLDGLLVDRPRRNIIRSRQPQVADGAGDLAAWQVRCLYSETIELAALGTLTIQRASHVEPDTNGRWFADLSPSNGPLLGPFERRSDALKPKPRGCRLIA